MRGRRRRRQRPRRGRLQRAERQWRTKEWMATPRSEGLSRLRRQCALRMAERAGPHCGWTGASAGRSSATDMLAGLIATLLVQFSVL